MHRVSLHSTGAVEVILQASLTRLSRDLPPRAKSPAAERVTYEDVACHLHCS
jgi:hypothetical protein